MSSVADIQKAFDKDLEESLGPKSNDFSQELRDALFSLWLKGQEKHVETYFDSEKGKALFVKMLGESLAPGETSGVKKHVSSDQVHLELEPIGLISTINNALLSGLLLDIPSFAQDPGIDLELFPDATQKELKTRLQALNLLPPDWKSEWHPAFLNLEGKVSYLKSGVAYQVTAVPQSRLVYVDGIQGQAWYFPQPFPEHDSHVTIEVNGCPRTELYKVVTTEGFSFIDVYDAVATDIVTCSYNTVQETP